MADNNNQTATLGKAVAALNETHNELAKVISKVGDARNRAKAIPDAALEKLLDEILNDLSTSVMRLVVGWQNRP